MTKTVTEHTPGPWSVAWDSAREAGFRGGDNYWVMTAHFHVDTPHEANARLIAAAPDLLAALEEMLNAQVCTDAGGDCVTCEHARAAIRKATGGDR